ncbi:MAG: hypothetical protein Q9180_002108 [Flavoplaca navasiana]
MVAENGYGDVVDWQIPAMEVGRITSSIPLPKGDVRVKVSARKESSGWTWDFGFKEELLKQARYHPQPQPHSNILQIASSRSYPFSFSFPSSSTKAPQVITYPSNSSHLTRLSKAISYISDTPTTPTKTTTKTNTRHGRGADENHFYDEDMLWDDFGGQEAEE